MPVERVFLCLEDQGQLLEAATGATKLIVQFRLCAYGPTGRALPSDPLLCHAIYPWLIVCPSRSLVKLASQPGPRVDSRAGPTLRQAWWLAYLSQAVFPPRCTGLQRQPDF